MERLHYRSTSLVDLQAEMHERNLLQDAARASRAPGSQRRVRSAPFGLSRLMGRLLG